MNRMLSQSSRMVLSRSTRSLIGATIRNGSFPVPTVSKTAGVYITRRYNSTEIDKSAAANVAGSSPANLDLTALADASMTDAATAVVTQAPEKVNFVVEHIMSGIDLIHTFAGLPYWGAIVVATIGIRLFLLPVALKTVQGSARMAAMRPDMQKVQDRMAKDPNTGDMNVKMRYQKEMQALFVKHKVNPMRAMLWPLFQFPVFIALFMALREMGVYYPDFATGGALWFTDLSAPDALLILPIFNSLSFLAMIEMGADGVQMQQQQTFKNVMRGMAVIMVPLTMSMPQGLFVYWSTNNVLSVFQTMVLKNEKVKKALDIPNPPAVEETPAMKMINPMKALSEALEKERAQKSNAKAEILEGVPAPPGPPAAPAPVSFAMPPRQSRRPKTATATVLDAANKK